MSDTITLPFQMNGQQKADQNLATFLSWVASRTDVDFREMVLRGQINRQVIFVGDLVAAKAAAEAPPHASLRQVAQGSLLDEVLGGMA